MVNPANNANSAIGLTASASAAPLSPQKQHHSNDEIPINVVKTVEKEMLDNPFLIQLHAQDGIAAVHCYLNTVHDILIASTPANWNGLLGEKSKLKGMLGYHSFMVIPGVRIMELGGVADLCPDLDVSKLEIFQYERRQLIGAKIEKLWNNHLKLCPKEIGSLPSSKVGYFQYVPFENDCFTYLNSVLRTTGEPEIKISRTTGNELFCRIVAKTVGLIYQAAFTAKAIVG